MSKTIDVEPGDTWTLFSDGSGLCQYRAGRWRCVEPEGVESRWETPYRIDNEIDIPRTAAEGMLNSWDYTITPAAKPEAKPADNILPPVDAAWAAEIESKIAALESRLAAVTESAADARQIADNQSDRLDELAERVRALEKPTTTGVVKVPAPVSHQGLFTDGELRVIDARDSAWRVALTAAGVKWEESK